MAGRRHYRNVRGLSGLEYGGEGGVMGDGEGAWIVGADGSAGSILPADEAVAAIGSGGDGGGDGGAGGISGDGGGTHVVVGRGDREGVVRPLLDVGKSAPFVGGLVVGEGSAGNIERNVGGNVIKCVRVSNGWRSSRFAFDRGESTAFIESAAANGGDATGDDDGGESATISESAVAN